MREQGRHHAGRDGGLGIDVLDVMPDGLDEMSVAATDLLSGHGDQTQHVDLAR